MKGRDFVDSNTYFDLCNLIVAAINSSNVKNEQQLLYILKSNKLFLQMKVNEENIFLALSNLIDDGLIKGKYTFTTFGYVFVLRGLTSDGMKYASATGSNKILTKIKKAIHDEGLPLTPNSALKVLGKILF